MRGTLLLWGIFFVAILIFSSCSGSLFYTNLGLSFVSNKNGNYDIFLMRYDGSEQTNLTLSSYNETQQSWSPDGNMVAYVSDKFGDDEIFIMNLADPTHPILFSANTGNDYDPQWSPATNVIAFVSDREGMDEIYVQKLGEDQAKKLTNHVERAYHPRWDPLGHWILYLVEDENGNNDIYKVDYPGENDPRLTFDPADDVDPCWSSDGNKIVFSSNRDGDYEIFIMNCDGSNQIQLTHNDVDDRNPVIFEDKIFFQRKLDGQWDIFVLNKRTATETRLTFDPADDVDPVISPDGRILFFVSNRDGNREIYSLDLKTMELKNLTNSPADEFNVVIRRR